MAREGEMSMIAEIILKVVSFFLAIAMGLSWLFFSWTAVVFLFTGKWYGWPWEWVSL